MTSTHQPKEVAAASTQDTDDDPHRRPGVPRERNPPEPVANAHWLVPPKQEADARGVKDVGHPEWTATFGTAQPPRGLSGRIRRAAYGIPDYDVRRWVLLMLADRVDSLESRFR